MRRDICWILVALCLNFNDFLLHLSICSLLLTCLAVNGIPTSTSLNFAQVNKFPFGSSKCSALSRLRLWLLLFLVSRACFLLLFTWRSFSRPADLDWRVISSAEPAPTILLKVNFPFDSLCGPLHSLFLLSLVITCSFGWLLFRYSTIQTLGSELLSILFLLFLQCPVESEAGDRWAPG